MGREGPRVREHNTRQLIAAVFFLFHFEGGLAVDLFVKGIWFEKCTSTIYQSLCKHFSHTSFFGQIVFTSGALFAAAQFLTRSSNNNNNCT